MPPRRTRAPMSRRGRQRRDTASDVRPWVERMQRARKRREDWKARYQVDSLARMFLGENAWGTSYGEQDDQYQVNKFWPTIRAMLPGLLATHPTFLIRTSSKASSEVERIDAMVAEGLLEAIARQDNHLKVQARLALQQAFFLLGCLKVVYEPTMEKNPDAGQPLEVLDDTGQPRMDPVTGQPQMLMNPDGTPQPQPRMVVTDEVYRWEWVNAQNILLPDAGPNRRKWPWIAEEVTVRLEEAQEDERFPRALRDALLPTGRRQREGLIQDAREWEAQDEEVTYIEIWDKEDKRHRIIAEHQSFSESEFLLDEPMPEGIEDDPYALLILNPIVDPDPQAWPLPHTYNWRDLQREYQIRRQQMVEGAKRSARKVLFDDATFPDQDEAAAGLQSSRDMEAVRLTDINRPPIVVQDPPPPPNIVQDLLAIDRDWREVTGQPGARLADPENSTATEALIGERAANLRDTDLRDAVQDWLAEAGRKMLQLVRGTLTLDVLVKLRGFQEQEFLAFLSRQFGPEAVRMARDMPGLQERFMARFGQVRWQRITREDLEFEADVTVEPGSARARSLETERQQVFTFLRLIGEFPQLALSRGLLSLVGQLFEFVDEGLVDELHLLAQRLLQAQQQQQRPVAPGSRAPAGTNGIESAGGSPVIGQALAQALGRQA